MTRELFARRATIRSFLLLVGILAGGTPAAFSDEPTRVVVHADQTVGQLSRYLTGACIEDVNHEVYGGIYSQMIFGESFQEPATSTPLRGFKAFGGTWELRDGVLSGSGPDGPKLVSDQAFPPLDAVEVEVMFNDAAGGNAGLILRVDKAGPGADNFNGFEISLDPENQFLRLGWHGHNWRPIRDVPCAVGLKRWIPLRVRIAGNSLEVFVDGKSVTKYDHNGPLPGGNGVGLRSWMRKASYRNLIATTAEGLGADIPFEPAAADRFAVSGMWRPVERGSATGNASVQTDHPFVGTQSQEVTFADGTGEIGISNQGLNHWGLYFEAGKPYEGYVWLRRPEPREQPKNKVAKPSEVWVALESGDGEQTLAETKLGATTGEWARIDFKLTPSATISGGQFVVKLKQPGSVMLGHAFLQPGSWGRFKDLPIRRDVTQGLIDQGITVLRYGGLMVNQSEYRWKKMIGPRDQRPPYHGTWYPYSTNGWGIIDFIELCEAAGFVAIPAFNMGESKDDMADFVEYVNGSADSPWGQKRAATGHPQPYGLRFLELGNEERIDDTYVGKFNLMAEAIWAKDPQIILIVGDFVYGREITDPMHIEGAASKLTSLAGQGEILKFAKQHGREVWFDVHVDTNGPGRANDVNALASYCRAIDSLSGGAKHAVVVFEFNANNHQQRRALANAVATHVVERLGLPLTTSANCLQPDRQNDNGWNQGLLFLNQSQVWLQPPGYVTQMLSQAFQPNLLKTDIVGNADQLDVSAKRSADGIKLVVEVVNISGDERELQFELTGFKPTKPTATVDTLAAPLDAVNTAADPHQVVPKRSDWQLGQGRPLSYKFPAYSLSVIRLE